MNQRAKAQVELIRKNCEQQESREKHKDLLLGLCKICHEENLDRECPLLEYMMEDMEAGMKDYLEGIMIKKLKTNINSN